MASITKLKRKKGVVYKAVIRLKGHPTATMTFDKQSDAVRWTEDTENVLRNGGYIGDAPKDDIRFLKAIDKYMMEVSAKKPDNTNRRERASEVAVYKYFKKDDPLLSQVTKERIQDFIGSRGEEVGPSTLRKDVILISNIFKAAKNKWHYKVENPTVGVELPKLPKKQFNLLTPDQIETLLAEAKKAKNEKFYLYLLLLFHSAMRPGEAAGLKWGQVLLDEKILDLTKTKTEPRRVAMTDVIVSEFKRLKSTGNDEYIFLPPGGLSKERQMTPAVHFRSAFVNAKKRAGIETKFTQHDCRHTSASYLLRSGVDFREVAAILGHKSMDMVMLYTHVLDDKKLEAVGKINDLGLPKLAAGGEGNLLGLPTEVLEKLGVSQEKLKELEKLQAGMEALKKLGISIET